MLENVKNIVAVPELRKRILFMLLLLGVFRLGSHIPTPGIDPKALAELTRELSNTMFGLYDMFSGGSLSQMTVFALGIMPYISASIILQLLTVVSPCLERLSKEGELGRRKITQYTRYGRRRRRGGRAVRRQRPRRAVSPVSSSKTRRANARSKLRASQSPLHACCAAHA